MRNLVIFTSVTVFIVNLPCHGQDAPRDDEKIIRNLTDKYVAMIRTEDRTSLEAIESMLADEYTQINSSGKVYSGKAANLAFYEEAFDDIDRNFKSLTTKYDIQSVKILPRSALVFGRLKMTGVLKDRNRPFNWDILESLLRENSGRLEIDA